MKNKTVFVLGAGFSMAAGAPSQEKLISKIFELNDTNPGIFTRPKAIDNFKNFLSKQLGIPEAYHAKIPLEDVFTPIDRCLLDNLSFRDLDINQVKTVREDIYYLIGKTLQHLLTTSDKNYIDAFAAYLVDECRKRADGNYTKIDNVSVITTNWDILLDKSIYDNIHTSGDKAVVDYCCHISSFGEFDNTVKPGLEILGKGGYNVKLLKLHGSLNWLQCPRCQRVYVDVADKIAVNQYEKKEPCRHCQKNFVPDNPPILTSNIIMPTFLKNLSNPQYRIIWQNAGIELSEAEKIVFIGYSLPQADYEMRQLLSRMVRSTAKVEVIGFSLDPDHDKDFEQLKDRYQVFFGDRLIEPINHIGAKEYLLGKFHTSSV